MIRLFRFSALIAGHVSARVCAILIAVLAAFPALILAGYLAVHSASVERAHLELRAQEQTEEARTAVERDILAIQDTLIALASSPFLQLGDIEGFYRQASDVSRQIGLQLVLHDTHLNQLLNTGLPPGTPLDAATPVQVTEAYQELLRTGKPVVSDLFFAPLVKQHVVAVLVPVLRSGHLEYVLTAGVWAQRFTALLQSLDIRPNQAVSIIDRSRSFVARSLRGGRYVGKRSLKPLSPGTLSVVEGVNREGVAFHAFVYRSELLGWSISTSMPDRVLQAPIMRAIVSVAVAGSMLVALAIWLAYVWGGRIAQSAGALGIDRKPTRAEFEILFNSAPNGVMVVDDHGRIMLLNARMEQNFGYYSGELIGKTVEVLVPERFRSAHVGFRQAFGRDPKTRPMGEARDLYGLRKDGTEFPVEIGLNPIDSGGDRLVMITVIDISQRRLVRQRLDKTMAERDDLRRRLIDAQEQERLRLAHELHDQTGQSLTAVMLEIKAIEDTVMEPNRTRFRLLRLQLDQVGQTLHHVAWELRPASIDEVGLAGALANYVETWSEQFDIAADFHCTDSQIDERSQEIHTTIYRVLQEALTNVAKHAERATSVSVVLECTAGKLRLTIEDNGCGFDTADLRATKQDGKGGLGIPGMRERVTLLGGDFEVESSPGVGTTIFARIPLEERRNAA